MYWPGRQVFLKIAMVLRLGIKIRNVGWSRQIKSDLAYFVHWAYLHIFMSSMLVLNKNKSKTKMCATIQGYFEQEVY